MAVGDDTYEPRMLRITQTVSFILPIALLLYGVLILFGLAPSTSYASDAILYAITATWVLFALYQLLYPIHEKSVITTHVIIFHIFALVYTFFVMGYESPVIACWSILYFISYVLFSYKGLALSVMSIVGGWFLYIALLPIPNHTFVNQMVAVGTSILIGIAAIALSQLQEADRRKLDAARQKALRQEEALSTVMNSVTHAIITVSSTGKIKLYNSALLGLIDTNTDLTGAPVDAIFPLTNEEGKNVSLFEQMKSVKHFERDDLSIKIDESDSMRLHINVNNIQSSFSDKSRKSDEYVCILRDITKEKSLEEERDEFISVVSHELRTPITIAEGTISNAIIMLDRSDMSAEKVKQGVTLAHDQVRFLANMVNDLSTLSRAERGVADGTEEINLDELAAKLYHEYAPQAKEKGLKMNLEADAKLGSLTTSRLYLEELLQNFITNAIKYTKEGEVKLTVHREKNAVRFSVSDTGIGISKSDQAKIFNKFYRSEDYRTRETGGTGLGLYVAAKLARKLGAHIEVKSRLNHGSTFTISLPTNSRV